MPENYDRHRQQLKAVYNRPNWDEKVNQMKPEQVMAIWKKYKEQGKIK